MIYDSIEQNIILVRLNLIFNNIIGVVLIMSTQMESVCCGRLKATTIIRPNYTNNKKNIKFRYLLYFEHNY